MPLEVAVQPETPNFADVDNLHILTSHSGYRIPTEQYKRVADRYFEGEGAGVLSEHFRRPDDLVAKDASDHAVSAIGHFLVEQNCDAASIPVRFGRMAMNLNGAWNTEGVSIVRTKTFGDVPIWDVPPSAEVQKQLALELWVPNLEKIQAGAETVALETDSDVHVLFADVHDTDPKVLNEKGKWVPQPLILGDDSSIFPLLLVSDRDGQAAHPEVRKTLGNQLLGALVRHGVIDKERAEAEGFQENYIYKGGYTTKRFGIDLPNAYLLRGDEGLKEKAQHLHFVQIELNRTMYLTPDRSDIDPEKMARTQLAIAEALAETAERIRNLDLGEWRKVPELGSEEYCNAMNLPLLAGSDWAAEFYGRRRAQSTQFN